MKKAISLLLFMTLLTGCSNANAEQSSKAEVRTVGIETVEANGYGDVLTVSGNIVPTQTVKASFKIPGVLHNVAVSEGENVVAGQTLATLDKVDYNIQLKGAQATKSTAQAQTSAAIAQREAAAAQKQAATAQKDAAAIDIETAQLQLDTEIPTKIEQAKAQYDLTKTSYDRVKELYEQGIASQSQFDEISAKLTVDQNTYQQALDAKSIAESKIKSAQSQLNAAEAQISMTTAQIDMTTAQVSASNAQIEVSDALLDEAKTKLSDTVLTSPIDGVVLQKISETGETIGEGYPVVAIGDISNVWAEIGVTDDMVNRIQKGQQAEVFVYGLNQSFIGVVDEINSLADTTTRTFPVKIRIDNAEGVLKPGMICRAEIAMDNVEAIFVPIDSVIHFAEGSAVFLLNEDNTVTKTTVTTGEITGDRIQIYSGLQSGDNIVTKGQFTLHDGDTVQIEEMKK